jgi:2-haloacid dehalogenase
MPATSLVILSNGDRDMLKAAAAHRLSVRSSSPCGVPVLQAALETNAKAEEIHRLDRSSCLFVANHAFDCIGAKSLRPMRTVFNRPPQAPLRRDPHQADLIVATSRVAASLC